MTTHTQRIKDMLTQTEHKDFKGSGWGKRHVSAWVMPRKAYEASIVAIVTALATYADAHREAYDAPLGEDAILGEAWANMVRSARVLLNGECGRLDCGTLDGLLLGMLEAEGLESDD